MDWQRRRRPTRSTHSVPIIGATNEAELRRRESGRGHGCMPRMYARAADGIDAAGANVGLSSRYFVSSLRDVCSGAFRQHQLVYLATKSRRHCNLLEAETIDGGTNCNCNRIGGSGTGQKMAHTPVPLEWYTTGRRGGWCLSG